MNVVTRKHLLESELHFPDAAKEVRAWYKVAIGARWRSFFEVRRVFADSDSVGDYVVFNIRGNRYRLITIIHYSREQEGRLTEGHIYIRSFLTHKEYDDKRKWNKGVKR